MEKTQKSIPQTNKQMMMEIKKRVPECEDDDDSKQHFFNQSRMIMLFVYPSDSSETRFVL